MRALLCRVRARRQAPHPPERAAGVGGGGGVYPAGSGIPCVPQSVRPFIASADMKSRCPYTETSPCPPGHIREARSLVLPGLSMS